MWHALAVGIQQSKIALRLGVTLLRGSQMPFRCFGIILLNTDEPDSSQPRQCTAASLGQDVVELVSGDALKHLDSIDEISFCFLDAEKEIYGDCYEAVVPKLVPGGILVADNAINHREALQPMLDRALADDRVDAMIVPIGKGELLCRKR